MKNNEKRVGELTISELQQLLKDTFAQQSEIQDIVSIEVAMQITNLAKQTIYCKVNTNEIPHLLKNGRKKLVFSRKALTEWMKGGSENKSNQ